MVTREFVGDKYMDMKMFETYFVLRLNDFCTYVHNLNPTKTVVKIKPEKNFRLPESKTDVYREGQDVFIHKSGNFTCPYHLLLRYL